MNSKQLREQLSSHNVPFKTWGQGTSKTIESLLEEINAGESSLYVREDGTLVRHLEVVVAYVFHILDDNALLRIRETKQVFTSPERERTRDHVHPSVSEKMKRNEDPQQAIDRALYGEELKLTGALQKMYVGSSVQQEYSQSFPGLTTEYKFYRFFVVLQEEQQYKPEGYVEDQTDKEYDPKLVYFEWKPA